MLHPSFLYVKLYSILAKKTFSRPVLILLAANNKGMQKQVLGLFCASILAGIVIAGLWPFHAPKNEVSWLHAGDGLHFGGHGVMLASVASRLAGSKAGASCSVEILLRPDNPDTGGALLAFYSPEDRVVAFSLYQSLDDLLLRRVTVYQHRRARTKWYIDHVFAKNKQVFVTITSGSRGTAVYVDGTLVGTSQRFEVSRMDLASQVVIGSSPIADNGWRGEFKGLGIYDSELTPAEVEQHYSSWSGNSRAEMRNGGPLALYLCNERNGNVVHDQMDSANDFHIPEKYFVLNEPFLQAPWDEFYPGWSYYENILINIGGFVPLGFCFCAYLSASRFLYRPMLATIVFGAVVSFAIEALQSFLPTRASGTTDIITNALGTAIGATLYVRGWVQPLLASIGLGVPRVLERMARSDSE